MIAFRCASHFVVIAPMTGVESPRLRNVVDHVPTPRSIDCPKCQFSLKNVSQYMIYVWVEKHYVPVAVVVLRLFQATLTPAIPTSISWLTGMYLRTQPIYLRRGGLTSISIIGARRKWRTSPPTLLVMAVSIRTETLSARPQSSLYYCVHASCFKPNCNCTPV